MYLPELPAMKNSRRQMRVFGGLNETFGCTEAEYAAEQNFSSRDFPALSTRTPRRKLRALDKADGMYHLNGFLLIGGGSLTYIPDSGEAPVVRSGVLREGKKSLVGIGTRVLIFPDKMAFDTADGTLKALGAVWSGSASVEITPCDAEGKTYTVNRWGLEEPEDPADGEVFLKVTAESSPWNADGVLEVYSSSLERWTAVTLDCCKISAAGIGAEFAVWDTVTVKGTAAAAAGMCDDLDGEKVLYDAGADWLMVRITPGGEHFYGRLLQTGTSAVWSSLDGKSSLTYSSEEPLQCERRVPDLDYLTECDNRVWGCSGSENVIYACKLGDPTNWFSYRNTAADSYAVTVGSDGDFTGAAACMGYVLFFKENTLHKLCGTKPSDFQLSSLRCRGVAKHAAGSLCVINETLYYLSPEGVMAWDGSLPVKVSGALDPGGLTGIRRAAAGWLDGRYYLCLEREEKSRLLVYDTERGLWHEEDPGGAGSLAMLSSGRQLYLWDGAALWAAGPAREEDAVLAGGEGEAETELPFALVTGEMGLDDSEDKYLSHLVLRLDAQPGTTLTVWASCDGGPWEKLAWAAARTEKEKLRIPLTPRRHDTLRLRLTGAGQLTLRSISRTFAAAKGGL